MIHKSAQENWEKNWGLSAVPEGVLAWLTGAHEANPASVCGLGGAGSSLTSNLVRLGKKAPTGGTHLLVVCEGVREI